MRKPVVCIVGRPNVGKSTLFNKLIKKRIAITEDTPGVTRDRLYFDCEWQNKVFTLIDTGGLEIGKTDFIAENIRKQAEVAIEESDVIVFAVDAITGITNDDLELANILRKSDKPIIVAVNKIDFKKAKDNVMDFYELGFDNIVNISAEQGKGLGDLLEEIINNINYETFNFEETDITKIAIIGKPNVGKSSLVNLRLRVPPLRYCTDNGAQIAALGAAAVRAGLAPSPLGFAPVFTTTCSAPKGAERSRLSLGTLGSANGTEKHNRDSSSRRLIFARIGERV